MCCLAATIVKYLMFLANLGFALIGLAILGVGVAVEIQLSEVTNLIDSSYDIAPAITITFGAIVFVIAFFGCCGAIRESNCMLVFYAILLIVLIIVEVVFASLLLSNINAINDSVTGWLSDAFANYSTDQTVQASFNNLQTAFKCCGTTGPASYGPLLPPASCCSSDVSTCTIATAYTDGCTSLFSAFLTQYGKAIAGLILTVAGIEMVAVIFSLCLANHARNKDRRY